MKKVLIILVFTALLSPLHSAFAGGDDWYLSWDTWWVKTSGAWFTGRNFEGVYNCIEPAYRTCKRYKMINAPTRGVTSVGMLIRTPDKQKKLYSPSQTVHDPNWYYWDSDDRNWHCSMDAQFLWMPSDTPTNYYYAYEDGGLGNDEIGKAGSRCPRPGDNAALRVIFRKSPSGTIYERQFMSPEDSCIVVK